MQATGVFTNEWVHDAVIRCPRLEIVLIVVIIIRDVESAGFHRFRYYSFSKALHFKAFSMLPETSTVKFTND